jgi:hypothetical protein
MQCIKHTTFETQETTCIEYDGVLFPHEYPDEGAVSQHNRHFLPLTHTFGFIKEKTKIAFCFSPLQIACSSF